MIADSRLRLRTLAAAASLVIFAAIASIIAVLEPATAATGASVVTRPFQLNKVSPQRYDIIINGAAQSFTIHWSGKATFPIRAYIIPTETCSNSGFTCGSYSHRFARGTSTLVWHNATSCFGSIAAAFTGHEYIYLVNAKRQYTSAIPLTFTCKL